MAHFVGGSNMDTQVAEVKMLGTIDAIGGGGAYHWPFLVVNLKTSTVKSVI